MATVQRPEERYVEFDEYIDFQLDKARNGIKWTDILAAAAGVGTLLVGYLVLFVFADHWLFRDGVPTALRRMSLGVVGLIALGWICWKVVRPYVRRVNDLYAAQMLERAEPSLRGSLFGLVDSRRSGRPPTDEVRRTLERRAATTLSNVDIDSALDRRLLMRMSYILLAVVLAACVYAIVSPKRIGPSLLRALLPSSTIGVATRTEILDVRPGDATVLAGEELPVSIMIRGEAPEKVFLYYSTEDRRFVDEPIEMRLTDETTREYQAVLIGDAGRGLSQDLTYRIEANDDAAGPFSIDVDQPPTAMVTSVALQYPAYTSLEPTERDTPPIEAIEGTNVALAATANRPLRSAKLVFADDDRFLARGEEVPLRVSEDGLTLTASWKLAIRSDGSSPTFYRIECRDVDGKTNPKPAVYPISIRADQPPEVTLHDPKSDLERPANAVIPLLVTARDPDFRLRELTLRIEKRGQELPDRTVLWEGSDSEAAARHDWDLGPLALKAGDVVSFYIQARDNREPEFNRRNTPKLNIVVTEPVAKEEVQQQLEEEKKRQEQELAEAEQNAGRGDAENQQDENAEEEPQQDAEPSDSATEAGQKNGDSAQNADEQGDANETGGEEGANDSKSDARESSVKKDGSQDDEVLRKLLERQRDQQEATDENPPKDGEQQADSTAEPKDGQEAAGDRRQSSKPNEAENSQQKPKGDKNSDSSGDDGDAGGEGEKQKSSSPSENGTSAEPKPSEPAGKSGNAKDPSDAQNQANDPMAGGEGEASSANSASKDSAKPKGEGTPNDGEAGSSEDAATLDDKTGMNGTPKGQGEPGAEQANEPNSAQNAADGESTGDSPEESNGPSNSSTDEADSERTNAKPGTARPNDEPPGAAEPSPGEGRPDQKSQRPDSGEQGSGQPNVDGTPDGEKGTGDSGTQPGSQQPSDRATGQSGGQATEKGQPGKGRSDNPAASGSSSEKGATPHNGRQPDPTQGERTPAANQGKNEAPADGKNSSEPSNAKNNTANSESSNAAQDQPNGSESGESQSGESQSGEGKSGEGKSGEGKSGERKSGERKSGERKSGEGKSGEGKSGEGKSGEGKSGEGKSGEGKSGEGKSGEGKSGEGKSGEGKSGEGKSGQGKAGEGGKSGQQGAAGQAEGQGGQPGQAGGKPGTKGGQGSGSSPSNGLSDGGTADGEGAGSGTNGANSAEEANADYAKQATDLALKKLEDDLKRGDVDPELLKDLGWTESDMRRFADRLRKNLEAPTGAETPQDLAHRKEFEHMLENLSIEKGPSAREARGDRVRNVEGVGTKNPEIPSAYRSAYEAFTRSVAGRRSTADKPR